MQVEPFGQDPSGIPVQLYTLTNASGTVVKVTNYGCIITSLLLADRNGNFADVALGFDTLADYIKDSPYFGAVIGRVGNRICDGKFTLDGKTYTLAKNNFPNGTECHLHGGLKGFDKAVWTTEEVKRDDATGLRFSYLSPDGEEGYPGNLSVTITYWLTGSNELHFEYEATTDQATPVNLTQHSYFNLAGHNSGTVLDHEVMIDADHIVPVDNGLIPTGELMPVEGTPFDFRTPHKIGERIDSDHQQIQYGIGYDHTYAFSGWDGSLRSIARVREPKTGRTLEVLTTEPGVQFYSGNFLDGTHVGKGGHVYEQRTGFCLETQHFPDSPNQPNSPSAILRPGEVYRQHTIFRFGTDSGE